MIISDLKFQQGENYKELSANISPKTATKGDFRVWFRLPLEFGDLTLVGDSFLAGFLVPCMYVGENLEIDAPVSKRLLQNIEAIQSLLISWYPYLKTVTITCSQIYDSFPGTEGLGTGCFFSGGVDSWYSFLKNQDRISHLILIKGSDIKISNHQLWETTQQTVKSIADSFEKKLITIETNLRAQTDLTWIEWSPKPWGKKCTSDFFGECSHGSFLAAVGLCLRGQVSQLIIPSTRPYSDLAPWGSHPLLDPLWSTDSLSLIHDGCEASRLEKIQRQIARSPIALKTLRVCYLNPGNQYNCCECEKCLRTMIELRVCGLLEKATSFSKPLDLKKVAMLSVDRHRDYHYHHLLKAAQQVKDVELVRVLETILGKKFSLSRFYQLQVRSFPKKVQYKLKTIRKRNSDGEKFRSSE